MTVYYRPILENDARLRPASAPFAAGGWCWFDRLQRLERGTAPRTVRLDDVPETVIRTLASPRAPLAGLTLDRPRLMGIVNVTPDSFSDGGLFNTPDAALARARALQAEGADILDIGGESTRPGADPVPEPEEIARAVPVIAALHAARAAPVSIDTRKAGVARAALAAGAVMVNDVAALTHDPALAKVVATSGVPICLMHAQGDPKTMQADPRYGDVLLDVYDFLHAAIARAEAAGIDRDCIVIDPGIGFGKTVAHNLALIRGLSLFHGLGCPILLGASRKRFIGALGGAENAHDRGPGTLAVTLAALAQGVQIHRVHDMTMVAQGVKLWQAITREEGR